MKQQGNYPASSCKESKNAPPSAPGVHQGKSRISSSNGKFPVSGGVTSVSDRGRASALSNSSVASPIKGRGIVSSLSGTSQDLPSIVSPTKSNQSSGAVPSQASVSNLSAASPRKNFQVRSAATLSKSVHPLSSSNVAHLHCASINWLSCLMVHAEILK